MAYEKLRKHYSEEEIDEAKELVKTESSLYRGTIAALAIGAISIPISKLAACYFTDVSVLGYLMLGTFVGSGMRYWGRGENSAYGFVSLVVYGSSVALLSSLGGVCSLVVPKLVLFDIYSITALEGLYLTAGGTISFMLGRYSINEGRIMRKLRGRQA